MSQSFSDIYNREFVADDWEGYVPKGCDFVPIELWGKDHWSTLGYLECRAVDNKGFIKNEHMRCNPRVHREFAHAGSFMGKPSPTRLKSGEMKNHDDWSCVEDMVAAGMVVVYWQPISEEPFGCNVARVLFTDKGLQVVHSLRRHKMAGGTFSNFEWKEEDNTDEGNS